jgi:hypothetical protein
MQQLKVKDKVLITLDDLMFNGEIFSIDETNKTANVMYLEPTHNELLSVDVSFSKIELLNIN